MPAQVLSNHCGRLGCKYITYSDCLILSTVTAPYNFISSERQKLKSLWQSIYL